MERAIALFREKLKQQANESINYTTGLVYYAGHGIQFQGENFLVPIDAELSDEQSITLETVYISTILGADAGRESRYESGYP
jgi:uncharacterized caspase-like protein